jgi:hypothetical protein
MATKDVGSENFLGNPLLTCIYDFGIGQNGRDLCSVTWFMRVA